MNEMMMANDELHRCAQDVRDGWAEMKNAESQIVQTYAQWVEGVLKAAPAIVIARDTLRNDAEFGQWCEDNGLGLEIIDKDNRAALIRVGRNLPYWRERLAEAKGQSLRTLIRNTPDEEVSQPAIPSRHTTKPGPKPRDNQVEAIAREHKAKTGEWPTSAQLAKKAEVNPRNADNALRAAKAYEAGQNSQEEKMISVHVLIEELHPLFQRVLAQSRMHDARISKGELAMIAGKGQRLLDQWASDDPNVRRLRGRVVPLKQSAKERMSDVSSLESTQ